MQNLRRPLLFLLVAIAVLFASPSSLLSQDEAPKRSQTQKTIPRARTTTSETPLGIEGLTQPFDTIGAPSLITQATTLSLLSMLPFAVMLLTSFMKIVIVLSLLRNALGVQQAPPNQVINGIGFMLSLFIMYPTGLKMYEATQVVTRQVEAPENLLSKGSSTYILALADAAAGPLRDFLKTNSSKKHQALFYRMAYRILPVDFRTDLKPDDSVILVPSYITSQLKDAFEIGVLIYIPFFVIDLVTSNILLAMGMMMLSPVTISMPLKLFLLVMMDGWTMLVEGLVNTYR